MKLKFYSLVVIIAAILSIAVFQADKVIFERYQIDLRKQVYEQLRHIENRLSFNLYNNIQLAKGIPAILTIKPSLTQQEFALVAKKIIDQHSSLRNIALAPDLVIQYIYPLEGNQSALGVDYRTLPQQIDSVLRAKESRQIILAGPVELIQGGIAFISRTPVFIDTEDGKESFWGIVSVVIDANVLYKKSGLLDENLPIDIAIRGQDGLGQDGEVFFGKPELFNLKNVSSTITVPNGTWQLVAKPVSGWKPPPEYKIQTRLLLAGTALLLFWMLYIFLKASMNASTANLKFRNLIEDSPIPHILIDEKQQLTFVNHAFIHTYGYTEYDIPTLSIWWNKAFPDPDYRKHAKQLWDTYSNQVQSSTSLVTAIELNIKCRDGSTRIALASHPTNESIQDSEAPIILYDITERVQTEQREKVRSTVFDLLAKGAPLPIILEKIVTLIEQGKNGSLCSILLLDHEGKRLITGAAPSLPDFYNDAINGIEIGEGVGSCGTAAFTRQRVIVKNIQTHPYWSPYKELATKANLGSCWSQPIQGAQQKLLGTFAIYHRNITAPESSDIELIEFVAQLTAIVIERHKMIEKAQLSSRVFNNTLEGIIITNADTEIIDVNPAFCNITGFSYDEAIGRKVSFLNSGKQSPQFYNEMWQEINETGHWHGEVWNRKKDGELYAELLTISTLLDDSGNVINYIGVFTDITHSKQQQEKLSQIAHYDVLTGLPNRALFADRFHQAIAHSKRKKSLLAVCFLDLDNFKHVNDNYGHDVGDQLLVAVAQRITESIREDDTVSRQGGDEFTLLLNDLESYNQCEETLERIHRALTEPYLINGHSHSITASIGMTIYPDDNEDIDILIRHADQAMYQAKLAGKHRYQTFDSYHDKQLMQKHHKLDEIQQALINNEFTLYYQPKVNMVTGKVFGVEALIRWFHPDKGIIPPLAFLPLIDGTDIELQVGDWVIKQALEQMADWLNQDIKLEVSVNIASHHLLAESFFESLKTALAQYPAVDPQYLQLEILESSALSDLHTIGQIITRCQDTLGVNVALDDFGTGYSSLTHLRNLTANTIKIDQSFIRDMLDDPNDYTIVDGVLGLADAFGRDVIAEGVETTTPGLMLLIMGCKQAQGYGIAKPMPADQFPDWLAHYTPNQQWLACGNKDMTKKQKKIKLFRLISEHWKNTFILKTQSQPADNQHWPIMSEQHDPCGQWIKRAYKEGLFDQEDIQHLEYAHKNVHIIAHAIQRKYQEGDMNTAKNELALLQPAFDEMNQVLPA